MNGEQQGKHIHPREFRPNIERYVAELTIQLGKGRLNVAEAARFLGVSRQQVYTLEKKGIIPPRGGDNKYSLLQLTLYLEGIKTEIERRKKYRRAVKGESQFTADF